LRGALARNGQGRAGSARARCFALCLNGPQLGQGRSLCASPPVAACQVSPWGEPERFRRRSSALRAARRGRPASRPWRWCWQGRTAAAARVRPPPAS